MNAAKVHPDTTADEKSMKDGFFFSRSFWELINGLPEAQRLPVYDALADYAINGKEPSLAGIGQTVFSIIRQKLESLTIPEAKQENQPNDEAHNKFVNWIQPHAPYCANGKNFPHQITPDELKRLKGKYEPEQIAHIILQIENRKDLRKKYSNLYLTVLNWAKREYG